MINSEKGITLTALVITIIVMIIISGIIVYSIDNGGDTIEAVNSVEATYNDEKSRAENEIGNINGEWGDVISKRGIDDETVAKTRLTSSEVSAINTHTSLQTINYTPDTVGTTVTIPADYNGGVTDQNFTQSNLGAQSLSWYVLSADEKGVNLVSSPTTGTVTFCDAGGYDNCLYYLNELSTKLFTKESLGVTADRVHAFRLTDIKYATEQMNGSGYSWETTFEDGATRKNAIFKNTLTLNNQTYPKIYGTSNGNVNTNNPMYDEKVLPNYKTISGDLVGSTSSQATTLTVISTWFSYSDQREIMLNNLSTFRSNAVAEEIFNSIGVSYWLASRCISAIENNHAYFHLRSVDAGCIGHHDICYSNGIGYTPSYAFRVVAQIPASMVNVSANGTVTLK